MKRPLSLLLAFAFTFPVVAEDAALEKEARELVKQYVGQLKPALKGAMQSGGPLLAVEVCAEKAPQIAAQLSTSSGWAVRRVSLKPRNDRKGRPDDWATKVMQEFDARLAAGESPALLEHSGWKSGEFRFMKAQPVEALCLACHGENVAPTLREQINRFYPNDMATGYKLGQLRGAFYLRKPAEYE